MSMSNVQHALKMLLSDLTLRFEDALEYDPVEAYYFAQRVATLAHAAELPHVANLWTKNISEAQRMVDQAASNETIPEDIELAEEIPMMGDIELDAAKEIDEEGTPTGDIELASIEE